MIKYLVVMLLMSSGLYAGDAELWAKYKELKSNTYADVTLTVQNHLAIADVAKQLNRNDIAAWNYNNAAYVLIKEFRKQTNYTEFNKQISKAKSGEPRKAKRNEFRDVLGAHWGLLAEAQEYLFKASGLAYNADRDSFLDADLGKKVNSNQDFIRWVHNFVGDPITHE